VDFFKTLLFLRQWRVHLVNVYKNREKTAQSRQVIKLTRVTGTTFNTAPLFL
jgi:hypothetical protein